MVVLYTHTHKKKCSFSINNNNIQVPKLNMQFFLLDKRICMQISNNSFADYWYFAEKFFENKNALQNSNIDEPQKFIGSLEDCFLQLGTKYLWEKSSLKQNFSQYTTVKSILKNLGVSIEFGSISSKSPQNNSQVFHAIACKGRLRCHNK